MKEKLIIEILILYYLTIYIHFMMEMQELVKYYLLAISVGGNDFNKISGIVIKGI